MHGQLTEYVQPRLGDFLMWKKTKNEYDVIGLLGYIKGLTYAFYGYKYSNWCFLRGERNHTLYRRYVK